MIRPRPFDLQLYYNSRLSIPHLEVGWVPGRTTDAVRSGSGSGREVPAGDSAIGADPAMAVL